MLNQTTKNLTRAFAIVALTGVSLTGIFDLVREARDERRNPVIVQMAATCEAKLRQGEYCDSIEQKSLLVRKLWNDSKLASEEKILFPLLVAAAL